MKKIVSRLFVAVAILFLVGCQSDYDKGVAAGRDATKGQKGTVGEFVTKTALRFKSGKIDESKSDDWNKGFRDGLNDD